MLDAIFLQMKRAERRITFFKAKAMKKYKIGAVRELGKRISKPQNCDLLLIHAKFN